MIHGIQVAWDLSSILASAIRTSPFYKITIQTFWYRPMTWSCQPKLGPSYLLPRVTPRPRRLSSAVLIIPCTQYYAINGDIFIPRFTLLLLVTIYTQHISSENQFNASLNQHHWSPTNCTQKRSHVSMATRNLSNRHNITLYVSIATRLL